VIGLGCLFPGRPGVAGFWSVVKNGLDTMSGIPSDRFNAADYYDPDPKARDRIYVKRGAFLARVPFEPLKYGISPKDMESIDSTQLLGLLAADAALSDAGVPADRSDHTRTAVILGVTGALKMTVTLGQRLAHPQLKKALAGAGVDPQTAQEVLERFAEQFAPWRELSFPGLLGNVTAGRIASRLNLGGANMAVDAACASSLAAVSQAVLELKSRRADLVVSGGVDTFSDPFMYCCFSKTPALSRTGEVRSFDEAGDGTMLGEGLGVVVLKRLEDARRDGNRVYAVIRSVGASSDGRGTAIFAPSPQGQRRAIEAAYREAGWSPETVELVEAHGTGTAVGDAAELDALSGFFSSGYAPGPDTAERSASTDPARSRTSSHAAEAVQASAPSASGEASAEAPAGGLGPHGLRDGDAGATVNGTPGAANETQGAANDAATAPYPDADAPGGSGHAAGDSVARTVGGSKPVAVDSTDTAVDIELSASEAGAADPSADAAISEVDPSVGAADANPSVGAADANPSVGATDANPSADAAISEVEPSADASDTVPSAGAADADPSGSIADTAERNVAESGADGPERPSGPWCALGSVKSQIGHTKAAAGAAGLIKVVLALHHKVLPPTIKVKNPLPPLREEDCPFYVNTEARPWFASGSHPRRAGVSAFGFGGSNFHCLLEEAGEIKMPFETGVHLLPFSAKSMPELIKSIQDLAEEAWLSVPSESLENERHAADYFSQAVDYHLRPRLGAYSRNDPERVFLAFSAERARDYLSSLPEILKEHGLKAEIFSLPDGLFFGRKDPGPAPELVYFAPGAFRLAPGTGRDLALNFPHFQMILDLFAGSRAGTPLGQLLYPPDLAPSALKERWARELADPAAGYFIKPALAIALHELYSFFGVNAAKTAGQGPGLVAALVISGWLPLKEAVRALGEVRSGDPEGLRRAVLSLPVERPRDGAFPELASPDGRGVSSADEVRRRLAEDLEAYLKDPDSFDAGTLPSLFPNDLILHAGSSSGPFGGSLDLSSEGRILPAPRSALDFAKNLARLASCGAPVNFRNWSYFTFPPPKPGGHHVLLSGANTFRPQNLMPPRQPAGAQPPAAGDFSAKIEELARLQAEALERLGALEGSLAALSASRVAPDPSAPEGYPAQARGGFTVPPAPSGYQEQAFQDGCPPQAFQGGYQAQAFQDGYPPQAIQDGYPPQAFQDGYPPQAFQDGYPSQNSRADYPAQAYRPGFPREIPEPGYTQADEAAFARRPARQHLLGPGFAEAYGPADGPASDPFGQPRLQSVPAARAGRDFSAPPGGVPPRAAMPGGPRSGGNGSAPASGTSGDGAWERLCEIVARETGYPADSLKPHMDLENDLGLDSIKKVELLAEIAGIAPGREQGLKDASGTLGEIARVLEDARSAAAAEACPPEASDRNPADVGDPYGLHEGGYPGYREAAPGPPARRAGLFASSRLAKAPAGPYGSLDPHPGGHPRAAGVRAAQDPYAVPETRAGDTAAAAGAPFATRNAFSAEEPPYAARNHATLDPYAARNPNASRVRQAHDPFGPAPAPSGQGRGFPELASSPALGAASLSAEVVILEVISRETGYPESSLTPELSLEGDLGLDSIKKVEILSALSERVPGLEPTALSTARTVGDLVVLGTELAGASPAPEPSGLSPSRRAVPLGTFGKAPDPYPRANASGPVRTDAYGQHASGYDPVAGFRDHTVPPYARSSYPHAAAPHARAQDSGPLTLPQIQDPYVRTQADPYARTQPDPYARAQADPYARTQADPYAQAQANPYAQAQADPYAQAQADPYAQAQADPYAQAQAGPYARAQAPARAPAQPRRQANPPAVDADGYPAVIRIVARETGYPPATLLPAMDLEDDLGLDSIKKVEILSLIAEETGAGPNRDQAQMARARTLGEWLDFFVPADEGAGPSSEATASPAFPLTDSPAEGKWRETTDGPAPLARPTGRSLIQSALAASIRRRDEAAHKGLGPDPGRLAVPVACLTGAEDAPFDPGLVPDEDPGGPIPGAPSLYRVESVPWTPGPAAVPAAFSPAAVMGSGTLAEEISRALLSVGVRTVECSWRRDLPPFPEAPRSLVLVWPGADRDPSLILSAMEAVDRLGDGLRLLCGVSYLGGCFGFERTAGPAKPVGNAASAAVGGLVKSACRELGCAGRVLDVPFATHEMPHSGFQEQFLTALFSRGPVEIGLPGRDLFVTPTLMPWDVPERADFFPLSPGDTVVATGGGRGVTAAVLLELARRARPRFVVLGRTPLGPTEPPWLAGLKDAREITRALHERAPGLAPRELSQRARLTLNAREIRATLAALRSLGSEAEYVAGPFDDPASADAAARRVKFRYGPVKALVHGAGVIMDHEVKGKSARDFAKVYATKAVLAQSLLTAFQDDPLALILFMSSSSARFGRKAQADYAAGNEVLNKLAWEERRARPDATVLSPSFGPFEGGMVDQRLAGLFASEGVGLIGMKAGARTVARVLGQGPAGPCELVILGPGTDPSLMAADGGFPVDASGGPFDPTGPTATAFVPTGLAEAPFDPTGQAEGVFSDPSPSSPASDAFASGEPVPDADLDCGKDFS
jgi:3-oxoacyl-(acyl-carrier-protein) synthase/acyl carrier protein